MPLAQPLRRADRHAQALRRRTHLQRILVRIHALREQDAVAVEAFGQEFRCELLRRALAGLIAIVGDQHALGATLLERAPGDPR